MSQPFSAARLRRSASFRRLTGVSVATFDAMLGRLRGPWDQAQADKRKPDYAPSSARSCMVQNMNNLG